MFTLKEFDGDAALLDLQITGRAKPQELPGAPFGATAKLTRLAATGQGQVQLNPGVLLPPTQALNVTTNLDNEMSRFWMSESVSMQIRQTVRVRPAEVEASTAPGIGPRCPRESERPNGCPRACKPCRSC